MKRFKRIISIIAASILVVCFALPLDALAATPGTTTTIDATYRCYKGSNTGTAGTAPIGDSHYYWHYNADGTSLNCPIRFMKESGTGRPIYCIEVGATFGGGYSYSTRELEDSPYWTSLSSTARQGITYTTMYGYPVNNYGAANCDAYAATQTIIWEFAKGYRNLSGRTNAYFYNLMISGSPAESVYNQLSDAVSKHETVPSFAYKSASSADSNSSELKYNSSTKQWEKTFTDSNNVLSGYNASGSGLSLTKSGNTLKVVSTQKISGKSRVTLARPVPQTGQALLALYSTGSQNAIIGQLQDSMTSYLSLTTENVGGTVSVKKANESGTALSGVVFGIYSDSGCTKKIASITTNSSGTATSGEIDTTLYPKVYVREDSMTSDQSAIYNLNSTVYTVTLVAAENVWANSGSAVVNAWKDGYVKVFKKDEAGKVLSGVVFGVYSDSGCSSLITKATTGSDGYGTSPAIDTGTSGSRTVYVKEYSMTSEQSAVYNINTTVYPVTISAGKTVNVNNGNAVVNMWKDGYVKVTKQNEAGTGLAGVVFGVYSDSECTLLITKITTGSDGNGTSAAIDTGTTGTRALYVKEISMTADQNKVYKMNTTVYPVTISAGKTVAVNNGKTVVNDWLPGKISVTKVISSGAKLSGAEFTAYTDKECKTVLTDMSGKNVVITTDKDGNATSSDIYVGKTGTRTVYVKETALDNPDADIIAINQTVFPVTLQPNVTTIVNDGKAVVNEYKPGKIKIVKENQNGNRLAGITFSVYTDKSCRTLLTTIVTDDHGIGVSEEIPIDGTGERLLYIKETSVTEEQKPLYELSTTVYPVTIYPNQTIQANNGKTIINRWTLGQLSLVKQNENGQPLAGVVFAIYEDADCVTPLLGADGKQVFMTTDEEGKALSEGIEVGNGGTRKLYVREYSMPEGMEDTYQMNLDVFAAAISAGTVTALNSDKPIVNKWLPAQVSLIKAAPSDEYVKGAVFKAYLDKELKTEAKDVNDEPVVITTDDDGFGISADIPVDKGGTKTIYLVETEITSDWAESLKISGKVYEVKLYAGKNADANGDKPIVNDWKEGNIYVNKVNENGDKLEGVTFGVFEDDKCTVPVKIGEDEDMLLVTDKDGYAISPSIVVTGKEGQRDLYVKELSVSEDQSKVYTLNSNIFKVSVLPGRKTAVSGDPIINRWKSAKLSLEKINEDQKPMSGVVFGVFDDEACENKICEVTTGEDGKAVSEAIEVGKDGTRNVFVKELSMTASDSDVFDLRDDVFSVILKAGECSSVTAEPIVNNYKRTPVKIRKSDVTTAEGVPGAKIEIYDEIGEKVYEGITGEDGETEAVELKVGKYTFVETVAPDGYVLNKTVFSFEITPDKEIIGDTEVSDKPVKVTITKQDMTTAAPVPRAEITIYDADGKEVYKDITKEDGTITAMRLEAGEYTFKETVAPKGYVINETLFKFAVDAEGNVTGDNTVTDRRIKGSIKIIKIDKESKKPIAGAKFALYGYEEIITEKPAEKPAEKPVEKPVEQPVEKPIEQPKEDNPVLDEEKEVPNEVIDEVPNDEGKGDPVSDTDETEAPVAADVYNDIQRDNEENESAVPALAEDDEVEPPIAEEDEVEPSVVDEDEDEIEPPAPDDDEVEPPSPDDDEPLPPIAEDDNGDASGDAAKDEPVSDNAAVDSNPVKGMKKLMDGVTDENGIVTFSDIPYGDYVIVEESAPEGYVLDKTPIEVSITEDGKTVELTAENKPIYGTLKITKSDLTTGKLIPNTGFRIKDSDGKTVVEGYTDENGIAEFTLRYGKYTYQEFDAPDGYKIDDREYPFEITYDGQIISVGMTNELIPYVPPQTGDNRALGLWITFILMGVAGLAALYWLFKNGYEFDTEMIADKTVKIYNKAVSAVKAAVSGFTERVSGLWHKATLIAASAVVKGVHIA